MAQPAVNLDETLFSIADAALLSAEADAAAPGSSLTFRPEWRPTPRKRSTINQPIQLPWETASGGWLASTINQVNRAVVSGSPWPGPLAPASSTPSPFPQPTANTTSPSPATQTSAPVVPSYQAQPKISEDLVAQLLERYKVAYDRVIDHAFPTAMGNGTASLDGFRYYMLQDRLYLQTCARLKMISGASSDYAQVEAFGFRHKSSMEYVKNLEDVCTTLLGITDETMKATQPSVQVETTQNFYTDCLRNKDPVLGYYVVLLPCVLCYWKIAERLMKDPQTVKNVVYHSAWTEVNYDSSSVDKYIKFINENIAAKGGIKAWGYIFQIACEREKDIFDTGLAAPVPYNIIPDGTYSIIPVSIPGVTLTAHDSQNISTSVLLQKKISGNAEKWTVAATNAGYSIKNVETGRYLAMSAEDDGKGRISALAEPYYWWINPTKSKSGERSDMHHIHASVNLRYALAADVIGSMKPDSSLTPVIAKEHTQSPYQMWTFDAEEQHPQDDVGADQEPSSKVDASEPATETDMQMLREDVARNFAGLSAHFEAELKSSTENRQHELEALKEEIMGATSEMLAKDIRLETARELTNRLKGMDDWMMDLTNRMHRMEERDDIVEKSLLLKVNELEGQLQDQRQKYGVLARRMRHLTCHWEPIYGRFDPDNLHAPPIEAAIKENGVRIYVARWQVNRALWFIDDVYDGEIADFGQAQAEHNLKFWALVGDPSQLEWIPQHGRFNAAALDPVPGWNQETTRAPTTMHIARFRAANGIAHVTSVVDGQFGVSKGDNMRSADYQVLCYKNLRL
ncbi:Heme oxygenase-like protein [Mycena indigotica]|uniref:Heme oxygenase-like protein n=1 Tax=Mycena indigotica TaxID=2126181 RepID=A0A8H6SYJ9_9AGAR|nr:Heme oxygenase-like protein [Mycena indigotica]KAF7306280.1 Heme oxygenase-like protein [Mycena indigotica]